MFREFVIKNAATFIFAAVLMLGIPLAGISQTAGNGSSEMSPADIERIVTAFTAKEDQFRKARNEDAVKRDAHLQSLGMGGQVVGDYHRVSMFTFDDSG